MCLSALVCFQTFFGTRRFILLNQYCPPSLAFQKDLACFCCLLCWHHFSEISKQPLATAACALKKTMARQTCLKLSSTNQHHVHCCRSTVVCTSHIFSRQCRRRNGLQTAKAEKLHCLFALRYDASEKAKLLVRPPHVCHMSGRCQNNSQHAPCASGECQRDLSTSLSKPTCRDEVAGCACKCITCKSTKKNQKEPTRAGPPHRLPHLKAASHLEIQSPCLPSTVWKHV